MSTFRLCRVITAELHAMVKWNIKHRVERLLTSLSCCVDGNTTAWRSQVSPGKASRLTRGVCRRTSTSFPFSPHHWHHSGGQLSDYRWVGNQPSRSWSQWHGGWLGGVRGRWHLLLLLPHPPWLLPLLLCVTLMQKSRHHVGNADITSWLLVSTTAVCMFCFIITIPTSTTHSAYLFPPFIQMVCCCSSSSTQLFSNIVQNTFALLCKPITRGSIRRTLWKNKIKGHAHEKGMTVGQWL